MLNFVHFRLLLPFTFLMMALPAVSFAGVFVSVNIAPPVLPVYVQPACPGDGYIWTPGYWAYGDYGYYWVPGTWVVAPVIGYLWTPGWWGWGDGFYVWHRGYWGPHVGFYGGVNYGYGYGGYGYRGGRWDHGRFYYNRSVNNVNITNIHNTYNTTVINHTTVNRVSYNGGKGGIAAQPRAQDRIAERDQHIQPTAEQIQHRNIASSNRELRASVNHGRPPIAATPRPTVFSGHGVVAARPVTVRGPHAVTRSPDMTTHSEQSQARLPSAGFAPHGNRVENNSVQRREMNRPQPRNPDQQTQQERRIDRAPTIREQRPNPQMHQPPRERNERGDSLPRREERR